MNIAKLNSRIEDITVNVKVSANRIVALDVIRGIFLLMILVDHIELYPSGFDYFTGRGRLFVSAAEGFFFMSGLLVGMVYKRRLSSGMKFIARKMWRRGLELYLASIFFTLLFTALAVFTNHETLKYGLYSVIDWPHIIKETVLMRYGFGWADFLDRFALLMFIAPFAFYLIHKGKWRWMLGASFLAWLYGQFGPQTENFTVTWQFLFNGAMLLGYYWPQVSEKWFALSHAAQKKVKIAIGALTAVSFLYSYGSVYVLSVLNEKLTGLPHWLNSFTLDWNGFNAWIWGAAQKWTLGPLRIALFLLWFTVLFMFINKYHRGINRRTRHLVELLGRNSLLVYIVHAFVVFGFKYFIPPRTTFWQNFLITAGSIIVLMIVVIVYKTYEPQINGGASRLIGAIRRPFRREPEASASSAA